VKMRLCSRGGLLQLDLALAVGLVRKNSDRQRISTTISKRR
jgi:hypothetical protein